MKETSQLCGKYVKKMAGLVQVEEEMMHRNWGISLSEQIWFETHGHNRCMSVSRAGSTTLPFQSIITLNPYWMQILTQFATVSEEVQEIGWDFQQ